MRSRPGQDGITLVEVLVSMLVVAVGLLGLMRVAAVAVRSNVVGSRFTQATERAQERREELRNVPSANLACLAATRNPASCLSSCISGGGERQACALALGLTPSDRQDYARTNYTYTFQVTQPAPRIYDIVVVVTFMDDSANPPRPVRIALRTAEFR